ncbi:MAG TPA: GGDEF domain-containing protein [Candidatus Saccharimonadales bacterium]|nr:GGDEF domain-containing protein [Candidatus Saccharimonadales bacterium]
MTHNGNGTPTLEAAHNRDLIDLDRWAHAWFDDLHTMDPTSDAYMRVTGYVSQVLFRNPEARTRDADDIGQTMALLGMIGSEGPYAEDEKGQLDDYEQGMWDLWQAQYSFAMLIGRQVVATTLGKAENEDELRQLEWSATHDQLTGLDNRHGLEKGAADILAGLEDGTHDAAAILVLDLNKFKAVNDKLSHETGDAVLTKVAEIIQAKTRRGSPGQVGDVVARFATIEDPEIIQTDLGVDWPDAEVARLGGDEFVVILPLGNKRFVHPSRIKKESEQERGEAEHVQQAEALPTALTMEERAQVVADRLKTEITAALVGATGGKIRGVGVSIGIGMLYRKEHMDADALDEALRAAIRAADFEMYRQKIGDRTLAKVCQLLKSILPIKELLSRR